MATKTYRISDVKVQDLLKSPKFIDRTGQRYSRLAVLGFAGAIEVGKQGQRQASWWCKCDCGSVIKVNGHCLARGSTNSCGCLKTENTIKANTKHGGHRRTAETEQFYNLWRRVKGRTSNPKNKAYCYYGGRGIGLYGPWIDDYHAFRSWMTENLGDKPSGCTLDRVDNDGNYEPGNLRWATYSQQARNRRCTVKRHEKRLVDIYDEMKPSVSYAMFQARYRRHWCIECCATLPKQGRCPHRT